MIRLFDLKQKEVINVSDGGKYGYVEDLEIDKTTGKIKSLIIPITGKMLNLFGKEEEYVIPWEEVKQIGDDLIIVDVDSKEIKNV